MTELIAALFLVLLSVGHCPDGWNLQTGVRRDGSFECWGPLEPQGCGEPMGAAAPCKRPPVTRGRVYCTGGSQPIVVDHRTVGCQMPH